MITIINTNEAPDHLPGASSGRASRDVLSPEATRGGEEGRRERGFGLRGWVGLSLCAHLLVLWLAPEPGRLTLNPALLAVLEERPLARDSFVLVTPPPPPKAAEEPEQAPPPQVTPPPPTRRPQARRRAQVARASRVTPVKAPAAASTVAPVSAPASAPLVVSVAASAPVSEGAPSMAPQQRAPGGARLEGGEEGAPRLSAEEARGLQRGYYNSLNALMRRARDYPRAARRQGLEGVVLVELVVDAAGRLVSSRVVRSSGHEVLDEAALADVRRLERLPEPPRALNRRSLKLHIPFEYRLQA